MNKTTKTNETLTAERAMLVKAIVRKIRAGETVEGAEMWDDVLFYDHTNYKIKGTERLQVEIVPPGTLITPVMEELVAVKDAIDEDTLIANKARAKDIRERRAAQLKAERAGRLTPLHQLILDTIKTLEPGRVAAEVAEAIGASVFVVSGGLSSLVEKGVLRTEKIKSRAHYFLVK